MVEHERPDHDVPIRVKIKDTWSSIGAEVWSPLSWRFGTWWWTQGNGSCDCNRRLVFGHERADEHCVSERYVITEVEPLLPGYSLSDFNEGYPNVEKT